MAAIKAQYVTPANGYNNQVTSETSRLYRAPVICSLTITKKRRLIVKRGQLIQTGKIAHNRQCTRCQLEMSPHQTRQRHINRQTESCFQVKFDPIPRIVVSGRGHLNNISRYASHCQAVLLITIFQFVVYCLSAGSSINTLFQLLFKFL